MSAGGPISFRIRRKSNLLISVQSVVLKYNCYCGVRIWTGLGDMNICSVSRSNMEFWLFIKGIFNASSGLGAKSLKKASNQANKQLSCYVEPFLNFYVLLFLYTFVLLGMKFKKSWVSKKIYFHKHTSL